MRMGATPQRPRCWYDLFVQSSNGLQLAQRDCERKMHDLSSVGRVAPTLQLQAQCVATHAVCPIVGAASCVAVRYEERLSKREGASKLCKPQ
jgi:hypothetical protein